MEIKQFSRERSGVKGFPNHVSFMTTHYNTKALPEAKDVGFPDGASQMASAGDSKDLGSIPGLGRSPGGGHGNPLQYSCLENPVDRGSWWATVHRATKSWTQLK